MITDDQILWQQLRKGNLSAFETLFNKHWETLFQTAFKLAGNKQDAEEIVSDFFIHLWSVCSTLNDVQQVNAYMIRAVKNRTLNHLAKQKPVLVELSESEKSIHSYSSSAERIDVKEQEQLIASHKEKLPQKMRMVYHLHTEEDMSVNEIAEYTNNSPQTVRNQLNTAYKKMKNLVAKSNFLFSSIFF